MFKNGDGEKYLTFSFYPSKKKMMVQGNHEDITEWITIFVALSAHNTTAEPDKTAESDHTTATTEAVKAVEVTITDANKEANKNADTDNAVAHTEDIQSASVSSNATPGIVPATEDVSNEQVLVGAQNNEASDADATLNESELHAVGDLNDETANDLDLLTPTSNLKTPVNRFRRSGRLSFGMRGRAQIRACHSSQVVRVRQRLEALESILCGLQGGVLRVVDSLNGYKESTEQSIVDMADRILKDKNKNHCNCSKDIQSIKQLWLENSRDNIDSINTLSERVSDLEQTVAQSDIGSKLQHVIDKLTAQIKNGGGNLSSGDKSSQDISSLKLLLSNLQKELSNNNKSTSEHLACLRESISHVENANDRVMGEVQKLRQQKSHTSNGSTQGMLRSADTATSRTGNQHSKTADDKVNDHPAQAPFISTGHAIPVARHIAIDVTSDTDAVDDTSQFKTVQRRHRRRRGHDTANESSVRPSMNSRAETDRRKVLIMGDSTTKLIDKRRLLRQEYVSMCRAATIQDAYEKINIGGPHPMDKIVFNVGLNDIRNGSSIPEIVEDMKDLIHETQYKHPGCSLYICSILPVGSTEVTKRKIASVNTEFCKMQTLYEQVQYVDISAAFSDHETPWVLFEEDGIHPNVKGTIVMMSSIRKKLQFHKRPLHQGLHKTTATNRVSYAKSVSDATSISKSDIGATTPGEHPYCLPGVKQVDPTHTDVHSKAGNAQTECTLKTSGEYGHLRPLQTMTQAHIPTANQTDRFMDPPRQPLGIPWWQHPGPYEHWSMPQYPQNPMSVTAPQFYPQPHLSHMSQLGRLYGF
jgi:predicted house-cleaning noncanonical NTP pyrophosphatase (MazG superfamily)